MVFDVGGAHGMEGREAKMKYLLIFVVVFGVSIGSARTTTGHAEAQVYHGTQGDTYYNVDLKVSVSTVKEMHEGGMRWKATAIFTYKVNAPQSHDGWYPTVPTTFFYAGAGLVWGFYAQDFGSTGGVYQGVYSNVGWYELTDTQATYTFFCDNGQESVNLHVPLEVMSTRVINIPANDSDRTVDWEVKVDGSTQFVISQQPGAHAVSQEISVAKDSVVTVDAYSYGIKQEDGGTGFIDTPDTPNLRTKVVSIPVPPGTSTTGSDDDFNVPNIDIKSQNHIAPTNVWDPKTDGNNANPTATQVDLLTNKTFRQGIDALSSKVSIVSSSLSGDGVQTKNFDQTNPATVNPTSAQAIGVLSKLPTAPTIVKPGSVSTFAFSKDVTLAGHSFNFDFSFDLAHFSTAINIMRALMEGALVVWFFFLTLKALKEAFA